MFRIIRTASDLIFNYAVTRWPNQHRIPATLSADQLIKAEASCRTLSIVVSEAPHPSSGRFPASHSSDIIINFDGFWVRRTIKMGTLAPLQNQALPQRVKAFTNRTKTGCSVCRKRRVKCDERRPGCRRCFLAGRQCPGYFDDRQSLRRFPVLVAVPPLTVTLPSIGGSRDSQDLLNLLPALVDKQNASSFQLSHIVPHIVTLSSEYLPGRAGYNPVLDAAVDCTAKGIRELFRSDDLEKNYPNYYLVKPSLEVTRSYTNAVAVLRRALDDARQSSRPEIVLAALLLCCFETMRENSKETVRMHMYGLSKIYEHRGFPDLDSDFEIRLLRGALSLIVLSCYFSNSPCYWSQRKWGNVLIRLRGKETTARRKWFKDGWHLQAHTTTMLANCSEFILTSNPETPGYEEKRQRLMGEVLGVQKMCAKQRDAKIKELSDNDPDASIMSLYEMLSKTKEGRTSYTIHYLEGYTSTMVCSSILRGALGGCGALEAIESACTFAEWLDKFVKSLPSGEFGFSLAADEMLKATRRTSDKWRRFAVESEESAAHGGVLVVDRSLFRSWLVLSDITPRAPPCVGEFDAEPNVGNC